MVLPTRVEGPGDVAWARLGLMDYLADRIRRGGLPALSSDTTLSLLRDAGDAAQAPDVQQLRGTARGDWIVESSASGGDGPGKARTSGVWGRRGPGRAGLGGRRWSKKKQPKTK